MDGPIQAALSERDFDGLIRGQVVTVDGRQGEQHVPVRLILSDIGFTRMLRLLDLAIEDQDRRAG